MMNNEGNQPGELCEAVDREKRKGKKDEGVEKGRRRISQIRGGEMMTREKRES